MTQTIDPIKLKAAAEHLEWVLQQYPNSAAVRGLLSALAPLIEDAKADRVTMPVEKIPCGHSFADGVYEPYRTPDVGAAYSSFKIEMAGGLTEQDKQQLAEMEAYRKHSLGAKP